MGVVRTSNQYYTCAKNAKNVCRTPSSINLNQLFLAQYSQCVLASYSRVPQMVPFSMAKRGCVRGGCKSRAHWRRILAALIISLMLVLYVDTVRIIHTCLVNMFNTLPVPCQTEFGPVRKPNIASIFAVYMCMYVIHTFNSRVLGHCLFVKWQNI